jgi:ABC-type transport system involved in multi-copper enzyme maturation permease subunit
MAEAGKIIIASIIWFQFYTIQLIAIIMLSNSISDEIYHRTLGVLMTTPINSFQIVMGKLFSKLLQLILLLAISVPLLAIVRVFGGVPWNYIISSVCITVPAVILVSSISLFFSVYFRRAYVVIIMTILSTGVLFALLPFLTALLFHEIISEQFFWAILLHTNPYCALAFHTDTMLSPTTAGVRFTFFWPLNSSTMLAASGLLLFISVLMVRKVALHQINGQLDTFRRWLLDNQETSVERTGSDQTAGAIRSIHGAPLIWKELRNTIFRGRKITGAIGVLISLALIILIYGFGAIMVFLGYEGAQIMYSAFFMGMGVLFTVIFPATCITTEKESSSWPLLLSTTLSDWQILLGKFVGILRRCLPIWLFLLLYVILFCSARIFHPIAISQMSMLIAGVIVFLSGSGIYFSTRFRRTTSAVVASLAMALTIWVLIPLLLVFTFGYKYGFYGHDAFDLYLSTNPVLQAVVIMDLKNMDNNLSNLEYDWPFSDLDELGTTNVFLLITMLVYMSLGLFFAWRAKCRFRRNVF